MIIFAKNYRKGNHYLSLMKDISKIVDIILSNTCIINAAGLYHGKAGVALALFEASRHLQSEDIENEAYKLFQEALIHSEKDFTFENGLSGIGYALCYLINNNLAKANFDEIFGEKFELIVRSLEDIEKKPDRILNVFQVVYFLSTAKRNDERPQIIIKTILEGLELFLTLQFQDFLDLHYVNDKMAVLKIFERYLKLVNFIDYKHFSHTLIRNYALLYREKKVLSSLTIGYNLGLLVRNNTIQNFHDVIQAHIENGIRNIQAAAISLQDKIDAMKLLADIESNLRHPELAGSLFSTSFFYQENLLESINYNAAPVGYKDGLARLLLFLINSNNELL